jgi:hypothetical protein
MQNGQITIRNLFDGTKVFRIPRYQRAYAWEEDQLKDFVDDFENQSVGKDYFFGTILFREAMNQPERQEDFEIIEIVDGQQRITTLIIFMRLILERIKASGQDIHLLWATYISYGNRYKLEILPQDNDFFNTYILEKHDGQLFIRTPSQRRLWEACKFLSKCVEKYSSETLQQLITKINRTKLLIYSVLDNAEATLIFETTNDRGKQLSNLEKSKSFLMHKTYLASDEPEGLLDQIQMRFTEIYRDFEDIQYKDIREDAVLQYHFIAFEKWNSNRETKEYFQYVDMVKSKVNQLFTSHNIEETVDYIQKYTLELRESFGVMKELYLHPEKYGMLDLIGLGRQAVFLPLLIKTFKMDNTDGKPDFRRIVRLVEIISFRVLGVRRRRSNTGRELLYARARDFKGDFQSLAESLKEYISQQANDAEFRANLVAPNLYNSISTSDLRYLFWKYENHLRRKEMPVASEMSYQEFASQDKYTRFSIEHIAPQHPEEFKVVKNVSVLKPINKKFLETYLHSLGNLTIDPLSANKSKSNKDVEVKNLKHFIKAPFKTQNELEDFLNSKTHQWDETSVSRRRDKILAFALDYWDYRQV